jgi:hypothetical protein
MTFGLQSGEELKANTCDRARQLFPDMEVHCWDRTYLYLMRDHNALLQKLTWSEHKGRNLLCFPAVTTTNGYVELVGKPDWAATKDGDTFIKEGFAVEFNEILRVNMAENRKTILLSDKGGAGMAVPDGLTLICNKGKEGEKQWSEEEALRNYCISGTRVVIEHSFGDARHFNMFGGAPSRVRDAELLYFAFCEIMFQHNHFRKRSNMKVVEDLPAGLWAGVFA